MPLKLLSFNSLERPRKLINFVLEIVFKKAVIVILENVFHGELVYTNHMFKP